MKSAVTVLVIIISLAVCSYASKLDDLIKNSLVMYQPTLYDPRVVFFEPDHEDHEGYSVPTCGGSIVLLQWILSSAECADGSEYVLAGLGGPIPGGVIYNISRKFRHPGYDSSTLQNNIALLKTTVKMAFPSIDLPTSITLSGTVTITGWGYNESESISDMINMKTKVITNEDCSEKWGPVRTIWNTTMCTSWERKNSLVSLGSPLVKGDQVVGIVSWSSLTKPNGYTRVYPYLPWIRFMTAVLS